MQVIYGKKFHRIDQIPYLYIDCRETQRREFRKWVQTVHEDASDECTGTMSRSNSAFTMSLMTSNLRGNYGQNRYLHNDEPGNDDWFFILQRKVSLLPWEHK